MLKPDCRLSISIVHHRNRNLLENCLDSIFKETRDTNFELIIVDNCSNEGIAELIHRVGATSSCDPAPTINLIENEKPEGFAKNHNKALKMARGEYMLILNDDTIILDSAVDKMVDFMKNNPSIGLLGCKMYSSPEEPANPPSKYPFTPIREFLDTFIGYSKIRRLFPDSTFLYTIGCSSLGPKAIDREGDVAHIGGACMLARREAIEEVGLFDENYFMFVEETDLCKRIREKGWRIYYYPSAYIIHYGAKSLSFYNRERKKLHERSLDYFFKKHYGKKGFYLHKFLRSLIYPLIVINNIAQNKGRTH